MLKIDTLSSATASDLEHVSYYGIVSKLGLTSFNSQGNKGMELVATLAGIGESSSVLVVGCGAGGTAVHLAESTGARVCGIDLSPESIEVASALAAKSPAGARLHFQVGDAAALSFRRDSFDVVIAEWVAFLLPPTAWAGVFSVLKPGGHIALVELVKEPNLTARDNARIAWAEETYSSLVGYRFQIPLVTDFVEWLTRAGFEDVRLHRRFSEPGLREKVRAAGGWMNLARISKVVVKLMWESPVLRKKFLLAGRVKRVLIPNRSSARHVFQVVVGGQKPRGAPRAI